MNVTTIIEMENLEVEQMLGAKLVFTKEEIDEHIVEMCVDCFKKEDSEECIETDEAMQKVFDQLKNKGVIPATVDDFSFELPSCEKLKTAEFKDDVTPQKVVLSYTY